jgi:hypothetical protein
LIDSLCLRGCAGAQKCLEEKEVLAPCTQYDVSEIKTPQDFMRVAAIPEAFKKLEECARGWIKHIEHVSSFNFIASNPRRLQPLLKQLQSSEKQQNKQQNQNIKIETTQVCETGRQNI